MAKTSLRISRIISPDERHIGALAPGFNERGESIARLTMIDLAEGKHDQVCEIPGGAEEVLWLGNDKMLCSKHDSNQYFAVSRDGTSLPSIVLPPEYKVVYKEISPDAEKIAFVGSRQAKEGGQQQGLFVTSLKKGETQCLIENALANPPSWSSDSSRIAIGNAPGLAQEYPLTIVDVRSDEIIDTGAKGVGASWSPGDRYLAFTTGITRVSRTWRSVPEDGRISILDLETGDLAHVTPPPAQSYNDELKQWRYTGSVSPTWSPDADAGLVAYRSTVRSGFALASGLPDMIVSEQTWVVDREGTEPRKVADGFYPFAWTRDSRSLYIIKPTQIELLNIGSLEARILCSLDRAKPSSRDIRVIDRPGVRVKTAWIDKATGEAFATILSEARRAYEALGFSLPPTLRMEVRRNPREGMGPGYTDGESYIYLTVSSKRRLAGKARSSDIYFVCHELGHMLMYGGLKSYLGLPEGVGEGWAHYAGSAVLDTIAESLGEAVGPESQNMAERSGIPGLRRDLEGKEWDDLDPCLRASKVFYQVERRYGRQALVESLRKALSKRPIGRDLMPLFVQSLRERTGDATAGDWIPQTVMIPRIRWGVKERIVKESFFDDLKIRRDRAGILLSYDHSKPGGRKSICGEGHAILFRRPDHLVLLDRVDMFGAKRGRSGSPDHEFFIFICDEDFSILHESSHPYSLLGSGRERWHRIAIGQVSVPKRFYVCIHLNPKASQWFYLSIDRTIHHSHSRMALPYTHVNDVTEKHDWMIRAHLRAQHCTA